MMFQRGTARRIILLVKSINPDAKVVVGGDHPSLAPEAWRPIRGAWRGRHRSRRRPHVRSRELYGCSKTSDRSPTGVDGLWFRTPMACSATAAIGSRHGAWRHELPRREGRVCPATPTRPPIASSSRPHVAARSHCCSFCSIIEMWVRMHPSSTLSGGCIFKHIRDARDSRRPLRSFIVDDNITILHVARVSKPLCRGDPPMPVSIDIHYLLLGHDPGFDCPALRGRSPR